MKACLKELVAKARLLPMESDYLEFVFDESQWRYGLSRLVSRVNSRAYTK